MAYIQKGKSGKITFYQRWTRCNHPQCYKCPHGPYWYACDDRDPDHHRWVYLGKNLKLTTEGTPDQTQAEKVMDTREEKPADGKAPAAPDEKS